MTIGVPVGYWWWLALYRLNADDRGMKRVLSAILWFVTFAWGFNYLALFVGFPMSVGVVIAAAAGLFAGVDPMHVFWQPPTPGFEGAVAPLMTTAIPRTSRT